MPIPEARGSTRWRLQGRSRVALLTQDRGERRACTQLGRCLMGAARVVVRAELHARELQRFPALCTSLGSTWSASRSMAAASQLVLARAIGSGDETLFVGDRSPRCRCVGDDAAVPEHLHHELGAAPDLRD